MKPGIVLNIQHHSIHDGPGLRTTVFLKGCPLRCVWCCNPESQQYGREYMFVKSRCVKCGACRRACPTGACRDGAIDALLCQDCGKCAGECYSGALKAVGTLMEAGQVMKEILKDDFYYEGGGGLTVSGGEAFAQPEFLEYLLKMCRDQGIHTLVETCGFFSWEGSKGAVPFIDMIYFDIKHCDDAGYKKYTGVAMGPVLENLKRLIAWGKHVTVRIPVVMGCNGDVKIMEAIADKLHDCGYQGEIHLLPYHPYGIGKYEQLGREYSCREGKTPSPGDMEDYAGRLKQKGFHTVCYG